MECDLSFEAYDKLIINNDRTLWVKNRKNLFGSIWQEKLTESWTEKKPLF